MQIAFIGTKHDSATDAVNSMDACGHDFAISIGREFFTVSRQELDKIYAVGVNPTKWFARHGRIMSVPGNDC